MQRRLGPGAIYRRTLAVVATAASLTTCTSPRGTALGGPIPADALVPTSAVSTGGAESARSLEPPVLGAALSEDGRTLTLYVVALGTEAVTAGSFALSSSVEGEVVRVLVTKVGTPAPPSGLICRVQSRNHVLEVALAEPLGPRPVLDVASGAALTPMPQGEIFRPNQLPPGWYLVEERPLREGDRQTGWTQRYGPAADAAGLVLIQRLAALGPNERFSVDRVGEEKLALRETMATWSQQANWTDTSLVWTEGVWEVAISSWASDASPPVLDKAATVAFAVSLSDGPR